MPARLPAAPPAFCMPACIPAAPRNIATKWLHDETRATDVPQEEWAHRAELTTWAGNSVLLAAHSADEIAAWCCAVQAAQGWFRDGDPTLTPEDSSAWEAVVRYAPLRPPAVLPRAL